MTRQKNYKFFLILMISIVIILFLPCIGHSQPLPGDPPPPPCTNPDDPGCPIDGGLSLMIVAGVGYGVRKYRRITNIIIFNYYNSKRI